jgi:hypothetical protein
MKSIRISPEARFDQGRSVTFVLALGTTRQVCCLKTPFKSKTEALNYLQKNRTSLEKAARSRFGRGEIEDGVVLLEMLRQ